jgi:hypothetical protein
MANTSLGVANMDEIRDLEKRIEELRREKAQLLEQEEVVEVEKFKKLDWVKDSSGYLRINSFLASGINRYEIVIHGPIPAFKYHRYIPLFKTITFMNYDQGLYMGTDMRTPKLATSTTDDLVEFLQKYKFKSFSFNQEEAKLYHFLFCMER